MRLARVGRVWGGKDYLIGDIPDLANGTRASHYVHVKIRIFWSLFFRWYNRSRGFELEGGDGSQ